MGKKRLPNIQLQELFMVKADWKRTYLGTIRRDVDSNGDVIIYGKVSVLEGQIICAGYSEEDLGFKLDTICKLKLDCGLHDSLPAVIKISNETFFLN